MDGFDLEKNIAQWNGNPADYPWFEPSPELVEMASQDPDEVLSDCGTTRRDLLGQLYYLEQKDYLKAMPKEVWDYRGTLPKIFGECEHGSYSIRCTYQDADLTAPWNGPEMKVSTEDETLVISMTLLGRSTRELIQVRIAQRSLPDQVVNTTRRASGLAETNGS